jgi:hypothetical protein
MPTTINGTSGITFTDGTTQNTRAAIGYRNRVINGDMRIWQRGTTITNSTTTSNFYTADRWGCARASDVVGAVVSRTAANLTGFQYALSLQRVAGNTGTQTMSLYYSLESLNVYDLQGQPITLSYWAKAGSTFSGSAGLFGTILSGTGTDDRPYNYASIATVQGTSRSISTTWTKYSQTGTVPSNATQLGLLFSFAPTGTAGADDSVYITGVQLEAGSTATEFERRPIGTELALCQRYYDKSYSMNVAPGTNTLNGMVQGIMETYAGAWYQGGGSIRFTTEMRRAPDFNYRDYQGNLNRFTNFWSGSYNYNINPTVTLYVSTKAVSILETAGPSGGWSGSPLMCHYTADAEL